MVKIPDFPNINTFGNTLDEAKDAAKEALNGCLESDFERGFKLPKPKLKKGKNYYPISVVPHIALAYQIRKLRNSMSQSEVARKLGISYQAYQKLENPRKCNPTIKSLEKISQVLGKSLIISIKP